MILHLGVIDIPYSEPPAAGPKPTKRPRKRPRKSQAAKYGNITTGDVAEILEARYHVMELFWELHKNEVAEDLEGSIAGALETFLMGGPIDIDPVGSASSKIEDRFKQMLATKELDSLGYPGIPTMAAQRGVSHRFKRPYVRRAARPSFIDTGLYQSSMKAWVD